MISWMMAPMIMFGEMTDEAVVGAAASNAQML